MDTVVSPYPNVGSHISKSLCRRHKILIPFQSAAPVSYTHLNYEQAYLLMRSMGDNNEVLNKTTYRT